MQIEETDLRRQLAKKVAEQAGELALSCYGDREALSVEFKGKLDFVSKADRDVENLIRSRLLNKYPNDAILGEEAGGNVGRSFWVVDPIDGTMNFLRGSPLWGVCLSYVENGQPIVGVMHFPALEQTLSAVKGGSLIVNGEAVHRPSFGSEIEIASIGESRNWNADEVNNFSATIRSKGWGVAAYQCASIGFGFAALGHTDGYIEKHTNIWDIAAGLVIAAASGLTTRAKMSLSPGQSNVIIGTPAFIDATKELPSDTRENFSVETREMPHDDC